MFDPIIIAKTKFICNVCGKVAGEIHLKSNGIDRKSFTSELNLRVDKAHIEKLKEAIINSDVFFLYKYDFELTPFYCPICNASYCGGHWNRWTKFDDEHTHWIDSIRGKCPKGHERMLED